MLHKFVWTNCWESGSCFSNFQNQYQEKLHVKPFVELAVLGLAALSPVVIYAQELPARDEGGSPRGFFGFLRKTRTFGVEGSFNF